MLLREAMLKIDHCALLPGCSRVPTSSPPAASRPPRVCVLVRVSFPDGGPATRLPCFFAVSLSLFLPRVSFLIVMLAVPNTPDNEQHTSTTKKQTAGADNTHRQSDKQAS